MDTSNWGTPIELSSGAEAAGLRFGVPADRLPVARSLYGRRAASVLVLVGFVLVALAQVLPWLKVNGPLDNGGDTVLSPSAREFSVADGASLLVFAYDVLWLPVLVLCAGRAWVQLPSSLALAAVNSSSVSAPCWRRSLSWLS